MLVLNGLTSLSPETAEKLAAWRGSTLRLNGLTSLSSETAEKLAAWTGEWLKLIGLTSLSRQTAEALFWKAAQKGGWALAKELLCRVLKADFWKVSGDRVLFTAVQTGKADVVETFMRGFEGCRADFSITMPDTGDTPLHLAAKLGHHGVVEVLLKAGAKPQGKNDQGKTVLQCAMDSGSMETVRLLVPKDL
jgi:hypothetical protein